MARIIIISLMLFCSLSSCKNNNIEKAIYGWTGWWTIDTIYYKGYNIKPCGYGSFFFDKKSVKLPISKDYCPDIVITYDENCEWEITKSDSIPLCIKIKTNNEVFKGKHKIVFRKDEQNQLLKMEISSDSLYVICRKGMFDYYYNQNFIDDVIKLSRNKTTTKIYK